MNLAEEFTRLDEAWNSAGVAEAPRARHAFAVFCHENAEAITRGMKFCDERRITCTISLPGLGVAEPFYCEREEFTDTAVKLFEAIAKKIEAHPRANCTKEDGIKAQYLASGLRVAVDALTELHRQAK